MRTHKAWYRKVRYWLPIGLVALVVVTYLSLNQIMTWVTQNRLDKLERMQGRFQKVRVTLFPLGYFIYRLKITEEPVTEKKEPVMYVERVEMRWQWRELIKGRLVRHVKAHGAKFIVDLTPGKDTPKEQLARKVGKEIPKKPEGFDQKLESMQEMRIARIECLDCEVLILDKGQKQIPRIWLHDVELSIENFATRRNLTYGKPLTVTAKGMLQHSGKMDLFLTADPLAKALTFAGEARLRDFKLEDIHEYLKAKTGLRILPGGVLDTFVSVKCDKGRLEGGIKPIAKHLEVRQAEPGLGKKIKAALIDTALDILSDEVPGRDAVATVIPIRGRLDKPDVPLWPTIVAVFRNAFVIGFSSTMDNVTPPAAKPKHQARR